MNFQRVDGTINRLVNGNQVISQTLIAPVGGQSTSILDGQTTVHSSMADNMLLVENLDDDFFVYGVDTWCSNKRIGR